MRGIESRLVRRLAAVATMLVLSLGTAACGSDAGGDDAPDKKAATTADPNAGLTRSGGDPGGTPDERIRASYDALVDDMYSHDARAVCAALTPKARGLLGRRKGCRKSLDEYFENQGKGFIADRPQVIEVTIRGKRALARAKTPNSNAYSIPFAKLAGEWKVDGGFETAGL